MAASTSRECSNQDAFSPDESPLPPPREQVVNEDHKDGTTDPPESKKSKLDVTKKSPPSHPASADATAEGELEVEIVQDKELDFLEGVTRLALLEDCIYTFLSFYSSNLPFTCENVELEDVRRGLMLHRSLEKYIPFKIYRHWDHRVMSVTDITAGMWCEVQLEYRRLYPHLKTSKGWTKMAEKGSPVVLKTNAMKEGSAIHLEKELEVHEVVHIPSKTKEDRTAIQLISTYAQLATIKTGEVEREVTVFGDPFDQGVLVRGEIDQLQYIPKSGELILTDNKTRRSKSMPHTEQRRGTSIQLMLYKYLLDFMCLGITQAALLYKHLHLDPDTCLTHGPVDYIYKHGLDALFSDILSDNKSNDKLKFGVVVERTLQLITGLDLPLVSALVVQYEHQGSREVLGVDTVEYDEDWMKTEVLRSIEFWDGTRPSQGVDIENAAWKCSNCQFQDVCTWRLKKKLEASPAARLSSP